MALPSNQDWPPKSVLEIYADYEESAAWYAGDMLKLGNLYARRIYCPYPNNFHEQSQLKLQEEISQLVHAPIASDIAARSAAFLFGEHPRFRALGADGDKATQQGKDSQAYIDAMVDATGLYGRLVEASDVCSGMGGVFLKVDWDKTICDYPIINVAQVDNAIPEFRYGFLSACTFYTPVVTNDSQDTGVVYRLVQRHEPGQIENGLYKGSARTLGENVGLDALDETKGMFSLIRTGSKGLACAYIPNMLPNRKHRGLHIGRADTAGIESPMMAADQSLTSLLRDLVLGMGRVIAPADYFKRADDGSWSFDYFKQAYMETEATETPGGMAENITVAQFAIRSEEHILAAEKYTRICYAGAGFAPQSFGMDIQGGTPESGEALKNRERASFATSALKAEHWRAALGHLLFVAQEIGKEHFLAKITPTPVTVEMQDGVQTDMFKIGQTVNLLRQAQACRTETLVRMVNPDKDEKWILAEAKAIEEESGMAVPDVTGLP